jgi:anti-anti-sigma regulatory factor
MLAASNRVRMMKAIVVRVLAADFFPLHHFRVEGTTVMIELSSRWMLDVERGPDWLFVRPGASGDVEGELMADSVWSVAKQHFIYRVVLECDQLNMLNSHLISQIVALRRRLQKQGGILRLCGLSDDNQQLLHSCRLDGLFPQFRSRSQAVLAHRPLQPR